MAIPMGNLNFALIPGPSKKPTVLPAKELTNPLGAIFPIL